MSGHIAPVSGDMLIKVALIGVTALVLGYYVNKATSSISNSLTDAKKSAADAVNTVIHPFAEFDHWVQGKWDALRGNVAALPYEIPPVFGIIDPGAEWDSLGQGTTATRPVISWLPEWGINSRPVTDTEAFATRNGYAAIDPRRVD